MSKTWKGDSGFLAGVSLRPGLVEDRESYPDNLPVVRNLRSLRLHENVTFLIGENGSGKSTLLEAIAVAWGLNAEGGSRNFSFATYESHSALADRIVLKRTVRRPSDSFFLRAESFYNLASEVERLDEDGGAGKIINSYGGGSLHEQSHGESFMATFLNRFQGEGFYLLDEPEAALSPMRQLSFLARLHQLAGLSSQFIIATHSPILMAYPDAFIYEISDTGVRRVDYLETEHYKVTQAFFADPQRMLELLFRSQ